MQPKSPQRLEQLFAKGLGTAGRAPLPPLDIPLRGKEAKPKVAAEDAQGQTSVAEEVSDATGGPRGWGAATALSSPVAPAPQADVQRQAQCRHAAGDAVQKRSVTPSKSRSYCRADTAAGLMPGRAEQVAGAAAGDREHTDILGGAASASRSEVGSADGQSLTRPRRGLPSRDLETKLPSSTVTLPTSDYELHTQC